MLVVEASFELISTDIFPDVFFRPPQSTLGVITIQQSINVKFFELPRCFTFQMILLPYAILCVFVLYSHCCDSISSKKLYELHSFESMRLLGALIFRLKQHTS